MEICSFEGSEMEIKTADANDAKEIAKINVATWKVAYKDLLPEAYLAQRTADDKRVEGVRASIGSGVGIWIKAVDNGKIIGYLAGGEARDENFGFEHEVYAVYVLHQYWGKGAGRALFDAFNKKIKGKGFYLYALRGNKQALKFYNKLGGIENSAFDKKITNQDGLMLDEVFIGFN